MAGTGWTSADLLSRFNVLAGRPNTTPTTDAIPDTTKYQYLADAEQFVFDRIASIAPKTLYSAPQSLTTADGGMTFTYGTDGNGYPLFPIGRTRIYPNLSAIPGGAWIPNIDYLDEGVQIRMPNQVPYGGSLYWYGVTPIGQMSDTVQPILNPPAARMLIAIDAVKNFAESANVRNANLADRMETRFEREFAIQMTLLRKHVSSDGWYGRMLWPLGASGSPNAWWL